VQIDEDEGENEADDFNSGESPTQGHENPPSAGMPHNVNVSAGGDGGNNYGQPMPNMANMGGSMGLMGGMGGMTAPSQLIQQQQMLQGQM
jgi:hypothetical protein